MTISYNWLSEYLPVQIEPQRLSKILTSIGLEVESMETFEEVKGGLKGLVIGQVLTATQHPNADKLKLTIVDTGNGDPLKIVCGAPNVAPGQKVIVATVGTTIYPSTGDPLTMKVAKIRGEESHGMICAEDEIGIGTSHAGILVLPDNAVIGTSAADYFKPYQDIIFEIGLTPNRMDAMSHWGVARDVCAYLTHHDRKEYKPLIPNTNIKADNQSLSININVDNTAACPRYAGVCIADIKVAESPKWLQDKLKAIGLRPINNIVDITNFIQHETGQPLHAFDYAATGGQVIVKNLPEGTPFITLDEKERKLSSEDLMICNAAGGMCIAGVFGGANSGVTATTTAIFLESAFFDPTGIRKTSFRHGLRTDAATRFEKGIDISNTVNVLKRAAQLIKEVAGGQIASDFMDHYPNPEAKKEVALKYQYLKKLSGKNYHPDAVKNILHSLGFTILREGGDAMLIEVPFHKRDVSIPADVVEEILRIDGLDNIEIPTAIMITPAVEEHFKPEGWKEKIANGLVGLGFSEILTNSITNSAYFGEGQSTSTVKLLNNLSSELDVLRPAILPTALEVISFNHNRKHTDLKLFEFGKTYKTSGAGQYAETNHLCLYITGNVNPQTWKGNSTPADLYYLKGMAEAVLRIAGIKPVYDTGASSEFMEQYVTASINGNKLLKLGLVAPKVAAKFDIKQPVYFANFNWDVFIKQALNHQVRFQETPKFPSVERDLALVVSKSQQYSSVQEAIAKLRLAKLQYMRLFDVFESEKLGSDKKSLAINFTFLDEEKTLTDKEIDGWMNKIMNALEKELNAEIRKQ